jgi:hypothetical protein
MLCLNLQCQGFIRHGDYIPLCMCIKACSISNLSTKTQYIFMAPNHKMLGGHYVMAYMHCCKHLVSVD